MVMDLEKLNQVTTNFNEDWGLDLIDDDIDYIKYCGEFDIDQLILPQRAINKFKIIFEDPDIQPDEFIQKMDEILKTADSLSWKIELAFLNLKAELVEILKTVSWFEVGLISFIFLIFTILHTKYAIKKPLRMFLYLNKWLLKRVLATLAYLVPYIEIMNTYLPTLGPTSVFFQFFTPDWIKGISNFYITHSLVPVIYFSLVANACTKFRLPRDRFIRFHMVRGLMLSTFQNSASVYFVKKTAEHVAKDQPYVYTIDLALSLFALTLSWLIPSILQAMTGRYPKNLLVREAVEIILGRDEFDPNFKWWNKK
jgi:hypothetical protein